MTDLDTGTVLTEIRNKIGIITLNNPHKRNALSRSLLDELGKALDHFEKKQVTVAIIRAAKGVSTWSAGHDIRELPTDRDPLGYYDALEAALRRVQQFPGPVIAMVQGGVWGGACDLAFTCDLLIGDPTSTFAITPVKLGLPYNASGILHFINRVGTNIAKEMFFTAEPVPAERALELGILNHLVKSEELETFVFDLAQRIALHSPLSIAVIKEQFRILLDAHPISPEAFERIHGMRRKVYSSSDYAEGIRAFLEKRPPEFTGT